MASFFELKDTKIELSFWRIMAAEGKAEARALYPAAYHIRKTAIELIEVHSGAPAPIGHPVHSRAGLAKIATWYAVDKKAGLAVIGPRHSVLGGVMGAHEFGEWWRGYHYAPRPTMGPALRKNLSRIPTGFAGQVRSN